MAKKQTKPKIIHLDSEVSAKKPEEAKFESGATESKKARGFSNPFAKRQKSQHIEVSPQQEAQKPVQKTTLIQKNTNKVNTNQLNNAASTNLEQLKPDISRPNIQNFKDLASEKNQIQNQITDIPQDIKNKGVNALEDKRDDAMRAPRNWLDRLRNSDLSKVKDAKPKAENPGFLKSKLILAAFIGLGLVVLILIAVIIGFYMGTRMNKQTYEPPTTPMPVDFSASISESGAVSGTPQPMLFPGSETTETDPLTSPESFIWPVNEVARVTSCFGVRTLLGGFSNHKGLDIGLKQGTPIIASKDGLVEYFEVSTLPISYGTFVVLKHEDNTRTLYGHLTPQLNLTRGQLIKQGEIFALSGNTGFSTGPHLHFEIISASGEKVDPAGFLKTRVNTTLFHTGDDTCWYKHVLALQAP